MSDTKMKLNKRAIELVQQHGINGVSFRTLADDVGIKSASVHYHFPSKNDLAVAVIEAYAAEFESRLGVLREAGLDLQKMLLGLIEIFEEVIAQQKMCLCGMMAAEVYALDEGGRQALAKYFSNTEAWLINAFDCSEAQLATTMSNEALVRVIVSGLEGAILIDRVDSEFGYLNAQREFINSIFGG